MMSSSSENSENVDPKRKRKGIHKEIYKNEIRKQAKLSGLAFVNRPTTGVLVEKKDNVNTSCGCKKQCTNKFTDSEKQSMLAHFYNGKPKNQQDTFLMGLIDCQEIKRRRPRMEDSIPIKTATFHYHVMNNLQRIKVCKNAFLQLYSVSGKAVFRLTTLKMSGNSPDDMRGKHLNRGNKVSDDVVNQIDQHIKSFPRKMTHYGGKPVTYLSSNLNIKLLHDLFCKTNPLVNVNYDFFRNYFNEKFGYRFGRPQVDVCSTCEDLWVKIKSNDRKNQDKKIATAELMVHRKRATIFYKQLQKIIELCKNENDCAGIAFDYMQNLQLPAIPVQEMFYLRKMWLYVFQVHDLGTNKATFYTYHEGVAKRGPNEVCSFLSDYIKNIPNNVKKLYVFSDACGGQNKNHTVVRFFMSLTISGRFDVIHQYFPIRGHSFLPCDRDFGVLKKSLRKHDRLYTPMQYNNLIKTARQREAFSVISVKNEDVIDFKNWWPKYFKKTTKSVTSGQALLLSKYNYLEYNKETPGYLKTNQYIGGPATDTFRLLKSVVVPPIPQNKAYSSHVPIKKEKLEDVKKIVKYIPQEFISFYNEILTLPTTLEDYDSE